MKWHNGAKQSRLWVTGPFVRCVDQRGSNPHSILTQPIFSLAVARIANSAALHGRCIYVALIGSKRRRMALICNG